MGDLAQRPRAAGVFGLQWRMRQPMLHHRLRTRAGLRVIGQPDRGSRRSASIQRGQAAVECGIVHAQRQQHDRPHPASVVVGSHSLALGGYRPGCTRHLQRPEPKQQQKPAIRGMAGWVRLRGTPLTRPWGLGRGIHAADTPATGPTPPSTVSCDLSGIAFCRAEPCSAQISQISKHSISMERLPRMAWIYRVDQGRHLPTAAGNCRRRGTVGLRGVSRMDAATKPPWTDLRRPRKPTVPRPPSVDPLLPLLQLWPLRVPGAARP